MKSEATDKNLDWLRVVTKERWELMAECRDYFLHHPESDPREYPRLNPIIAASWARSQAAGLHIDKNIPEQFVSPRQLKKIQQRDAVLLKIAHDVFEPFRNLINLTGYRLYLFDKDGVMLYTQGRQEKNNRWFSGKPGKICREDTVGTCSHVLSMRYLEPIQLLSVEQYGAVFENMIGTAAPICDADGNIHATVVLNQRIASLVLTDNYRETCAHTLGLVASMAEAIELQYRLVETSQRLCQSNIAQRRASEALSVMLNLLDDGILSIDGHGNITNINKMGRQLLGIGDKEKLTGMTIAGFTDDAPRLYKTLAAGSQAVMELDMGRRQPRTNCQVVIYPAKTSGAILKINRMKNINASMSRRVGSQSPYNFNDIIGESSLIKRTLELGKRFAVIDEAVLICGESGTGKELLAQAIHNASGRQGPFVALNCAALPRDLIESELFGYESGSFTGADKNGRPGKIELAHEGTLFLDEIGDMPLELQPVFLRVLENKEVIRIGGRQSRKVDFRIVAATNRDLQQMQLQGLFRSDLYFRLSVLTLQLPPLRQRGADIVLLAKFFIEKYCRKIGVKEKKLTAEAEEWLCSYPWPGNIRQLENAMIYAANVAAGDSIDIHCFPESIQREKLPAQPVHEQTDVTPRNEWITLADWEKQAIRHALERTSGNVTQAALQLKISKATIYKKMREYQIQPLRN